MKVRAIKHRHVFHVGSFVAQFEATGANAGFGGRLARNEFTLGTTAGVEPGTNLAKGAVNESHSRDTPVELYGYSLPLASDVPYGEGNLPEDIGRFAVGYVVGLEVGGQSNPGEAIGISASLLPIGLGMEGSTSHVTALQLLPADPAPMTTVEPG